MPPPAAADVGEPPPEPRQVDVPPKAPDGAGDAAAAPDARARLDPVWLVLGLVVVSLLPLILARQLNFETSNPYTFDGYFETTVPWTLAVVVPLVSGALLILLRSRLPWALPPAFGLVVGVAFVLTEDSAFWAAFMVDQRASYDPGPALWSLFAAWAVVVAASVVIVTRTPLATRVQISKDWRIGCALVVLAGTVVSMGTVSEAASPWIWTWIENNAASVLLGVLALGLTLLRLRADQARAGLAAVAVLGFWVLYFAIQDYRQQFSGIDPGKRMTEIICVVLILLACCAAQGRAALRPAATAPPPR